MELNIELLDKEHLLAFAGDEFFRLASRIHMGQALPGRNGICIGRFDAFDLPCPSGDAIKIDVSAGKGMVAGSTAGMVLFAVYRFFECCGARWLFPGEGGEFLPSCNLLEKSVSLLERASHKHRGICIEGANSYENIRDMIDWLPRFGFNEYFIQFRSAHIFFKRYYEHRKNDCLQPEAFSREDAICFTKRLTEEIKKRGLLFQAVGHGWTCEPFGMEGLGWDAMEYCLTPEQKRHFALVNGERGIWNNVALEASLCLSQKDTRQIVINSACSYLKENPSVDYLHFWLSDGKNNVCECPECQKTTLSDQYIHLLNELDEQMVQQGLPQKIVFLSYLDLLWPPIKEKLRRPERFLLMFAPISRTYTNSLKGSKPLPSLPAYKRNDNQFPQNIEENLAFLSAWQKTFDGDSFLFDYHMMWDHYKDFSYHSAARILHEDIAHLDDLPLNGFVSCQVQRCFLPDGLPMAVMGWSLWEAYSPYEELETRWYQYCYKEAAQKIQTYRQEISQLFCSPLLRLEIPIPNQEAAKKFEQIPAHILACKPFLESQRLSEDDPHRQLFQNLLYWGEILSRLAPALSAFALGKHSLCEQLWLDTKRFLWEHELEYQSFLDVFELINTYEKKIFKEG